MIGRYLLLCVIWLSWSITITTIENKFSHGTFVLIVILSGTVLLIITTRILYNIAKKDGWNSNTRDD